MAEEWIEAKPTPYPYGFFPYIRERLKGTKGISLYGFEDGLWCALFSDWGDERGLSR